MSRFLKRNNGGSYKDLSEFSNPSNSAPQKIRKVSRIPINLGCSALFFTNANCKKQTEIVTILIKTCHGNCHKMVGVPKTHRLYFLGINARIASAIPLRAASISIICWYSSVIVYIVDQPTSPWICFWVKPHCIIYDAKKCRNLWSVKMGSVECFRTKFTEIYRINLSLHLAIHSWIYLAQEESFINDASVSSSSL